MDFEQLAVICEKCDGNKTVRTPKWETYRKEIDYLTSELCDRGKEPRKAYL
ncbi:hypothetical protein [Bacillus wiedmannii]|uniref:hypothetical protein n=1 Tax=Bacillus wiedmannii TaxID=1890302 RepID=UPI003D98E491